MHETFKMEEADTYVRAEKPEGNHLFHLLHAEGF